MCNFNTYINTKIPLVLFKTGPEEFLSDNIRKNIENNCKILRCKYKYYNDEDCREFIETYFENKVLKAYDSLIPTAYKADLFRYCILYIKGGIYGDLTQIHIEYIDVNKNNIDMLLVKDNNVDNHYKFPNLSPEKDCIQINFIATIPNNNFLKYLIDNITTDILNKKKGNNPLDITGPCAFGSYFKKFFNINTIKLNLNTYIGLDNKKYKINIPYKKCNDYICDINSNKKIIKIKMNDHEKIIYNYNNIDKSPNKNHYDYQWRNNIIYL